MPNPVIPPYFPQATLGEDYEDEQKLLPHEDDHQLDALSLRDLPIANSVPPPPSLLKSTATAVVNNIYHSPRSSSSSSSDPTSDFFFEFLINHDDDLITSVADDVIFHGRLLPYVPPPLPRRSLSLSSVAARLTRPQLAHHESSSPPSESLPSIRPSRSLNYRKLRRNRSSTKPKAGDVIQRSSWNNSSDKSPAKLPWYWALVFGLPKIPAEMELKDIKNRQFRRNTTTWPPSSRLNPGNRNCSSASWKILNVLSCKSRATVEVSNAAPFRNSLEEHNGCWLV